MVASEDRHPGADPRVLREALVVLQGEVHDTLQPGRGDVGQVADEPRLLLQSVPRSPRGLEQHQARGPRRCLHCEGHCNRAANAPAHQVGTLDL